MVGFIEPHFLAGFSGGYKGIFPAVADIASIMHYHRASVIGHERSTLGVLDGKPTQEHIRAYAALVPLDFCINVTLNERREPTGVFAGDPICWPTASSARPRAPPYVPPPGVTWCDRARAACSYGADRRRRR